MTANQINYQNMLVNRATQLENARHNVYTEGQTDYSLHETKRHNQVVEVESQRHNRAGEQLTRAQNAENVRHNRRTEQLSAKDVATRRYASRETHRHNVATEVIGRKEAQTRYFQAQNQAKLIPSQQALNFAAAGLNRANIKRALSEVPLNRARTKSENVKRSMDKYQASMQPSLTKRALKKSDAETNLLRTQRNAAASQSALNRAKAEEAREKTWWIMPNNIMNYIFEGTNAISNLAKAGSSLLDSVLPF